MAMGVCRQERQDDCQQKSSQKTGISDGLPEIRQEKKG
jgi:hypothetical protein